MKIQFVPEVVFSLETCQKPGVSIQFKKISLPIQKALQALQEGIYENTISEILEDEHDLLCYYCHLEELRKHGFLQYQTSLLKMSAIDDICPLKNVDVHQFQLSRFALCRQLDGEFIMETPLSSIRAYLFPEGVQLIHALSQPIMLDKLIHMFSHIAPEEIKETLLLLAAANLVTSSEEESSEMAHWEFHDLLFHTRSRKGRFDAPFGGTFRFKGVYPSQPGVKACSRQPLIALPRPKKELDLSLEQAMSNRKSIREHGKIPISLEELGEFLWHSARVKKGYFSNDEEFTARPYPAGGARYELEIYPVVYHCESLASSVYHYHPIDHALCKVSDLNEQAEKLLVRARQCAGKKEFPQVLLIISARFQRVSWKYQSVAYALILKNLGVLFQTMYLVATASRLAPCAIGCGDSDQFCKVVGTNYLEETSVGEFMLGSLPL